jgi:hypothetical protein
MKSITVLLTAIVLSACSATTANTVPPCGTTSSGGHRSGDGLTTYSVTPCDASTKPTVTGKHIMFASTGR